MTSSFKPAASSGELVALLTGLKLRKNTLAVTAGAAAAKIDILGHPIPGPIFSGPHQQPLICQTEANGLGPATDLECSAKTIVEY